MVNDGQMETTALRVLTAPHVDRWNVSDGRQMVLWAKVGRDMVCILRVLPRQIRRTIDFWERGFAAATKRNTLHFAGRVWTGPCKCLHNRIGVLSFPALPGVWRMATPSRGAVTAGGTPVDLILLAGDREPRACPHTARPTTKTRYNRLSQALPTGRSSCLLSALLGRKGERKRRMTRRSKSI